jgi:lysophospholipase L1-like esterase
MTPRRTIGWLATLLLTLSLMAAGSASATLGRPMDVPAALPAAALAADTGTPAAGTTGATSTTRHTVLALGDSVPSGHHCDCRPFPQTYGALLGATTGVPVTVDNRAVSGLDTAGLLAQLRSPGVQAAVRASDVILVTIGANDFGSHHDQVVDGECGNGNADCVSDQLQAMRTRLAAALALIDRLRQGLPTSVLVTGYWNVFEDGDVARRAYGETGLQASLRLTRRANAAIRSVATAAAARYVDLYRPFEESGRDVTSLMAADGDHPDAAGHELIARTLLAAGLPG